MGRFESTVAFYDLYREPYPAEFFAEVAGRLRFAGTERLLDIACGPAPLAIGFAPYVASCVGVDPEPGMLAAARELSGQAGARLELIESRFEDLPTSAGVFQSDPDASYRKFLASRIADATATIWLSHR